jgi:hypothetical protein
MKRLEEKAAHKAVNHGISYRTIHGRSNLMHSLFVGCLPLTVCLAAAETRQDFTTPKAAANSYFLAMKAGDEMAVNAASIGTSYQKQWMVMFMRSCLAYEKLDKAASVKFGREQTDKVFGELKRTCSLVTDALSGLTNCDLKIDGTNATIACKPSQTGGAPDPLRLQEVGGEWKVVLDSGIDKADFSAALMEALAGSMEKCATDIGAGKYRTAEEAQQAQMSAMTTQYMQSPERRAIGGNNPSAMQMKWEEFVTPGPAHKALEPLVGEWDVEAPWTGVSKATTRRQWILGGRYLQEEFTGEINQKPYQGLGIMGYDNFRKKYFSTWIHTVATSFAISEGTMDADGKVLTLLGKADDPMTGQKEKPTKCLIHILGPDKHTIEFYDPTRGENSKVGESVYTRKR